MHLKPVEQGKGLFWSIALLAGLYVMGCTASAAGTRSTQMEPPQELTNHFLVIQDTQDGNVTHAWTLNTGFNWRMHDDMGEHQGELDSRLMLASRRQRDCNQEHHECYRRCKKRKPPYPYEYKQPSHSTYCRETCQEEYMECLKATGQYPVEFVEFNGAVDWLKRYRKEILVGTVIVMAGVAFVVVSAGAGVLVLAPLVLT
jgi:hypothetical protein